MKEIMTRLGSGIRTFRNCWSEAIHKARENEPGFSPKRAFRKMGAAKRAGGEGSPTVPDPGIGSPSTEQDRSHPG